MMKRVMCLLLALLLCGTVCAETAEPAVSMLETLDFTCDTADGGTFTLSEHLGKVVFVNFWATWCGPCCMEMPAINELAARYAESEDVTILTVNLGDRIDVVQEFLKDNGYTMQAACDVNNDVVMLYGVYSIPATVIFDKNGEVYTAWIGVAGSVDELCQHCVDIIEELR